MSGTSHNEAVQDYMRKLARYLAPLNSADVDEVIREIESHVLELIEQRQAAGLPVDAERLLAGFGDPRELAASYVAHVLAGTPPPRGFRVLHSVKRGVTRGLYWTMALFGYLVAGLCAVLAIAKFLAPEAVGVWSAANGNSVVVGWTANELPNEEELLGSLLLPLAFLLAAAIGLLTHRVLSVLGQRLERGARR